MDFFSFIRYIAFQKNDKGFMANSPMVTVIIPVYNGEKFLESALESVFSQTLPSGLQVIVVDDGSTDQSSSIAKNHTDVHYLYQSNKGVSAARNAGLELARGDFIAFLDADDIWKPKKLEVQVSYMEQHPEIGITGTYAENFLESGTELPLHIKAKADWQKLDDYIIPSTMMVRTSAFKEIGGFDTEMPSGEDTEWLWRAKQAGIEEYIIEKFLVRRRFHGENLSWKYAGENKNRLLWIARKSIQRKSKKSSPSLAMEKEDVSVIIVVRNGEKFLKKAIESVLNQTVAPAEILLVDGKSTDRTKEIARSYSEIKILPQINSGLANARNIGIEHAECNLIAFLDHDDFWVSNKLEQQVEVFLQVPETQYCYGQVQLFLEEGIERRPGFEEHHFNREQIGRTPGTLIARKSLFDEIGGFDPKYSIACDVDWFTRAADLNVKAAFIPEILLHKRIHVSNLSSNVKTNKKELFRVIKESLDRQQQVRQGF